MLKQRGIPDGVERSSTVISFTVLNHESWVLLLKVVSHEKFSGVFWIEEEKRRFLAVKSSLKGFQVHGERLAASEGNEYRSWDPNTSKLSAAIVKELKALPFQKGCRVLYLGSASGVTPSFISDLVGENGVVYCVEFSPRMMREFLLKCEKKRNLLPILADARKPGGYSEMVGEKVDLVYQDVAQPDQAEILLENAEKFLKPNGCAMLAIKSQSIDVTKPPNEVYEMVLKKLGPKFEVLQKIELSPFDKGHLFVLLKAKK